MVLVSGLTVGTAPPRAVGATVDLRGNAITDTFIVHTGKKTHGMALPADVVTIRRWDGGGGDCVTCGKTMLTIRAVY